MTVSTVDCVAIIAILLVLAVGLILAGYELAHLLIG
jgi:hypothetical protein